MKIGLEDNLKLSFLYRRAFLSRLGMDGEIIQTQGHSDDSISLTLDEDDGTAFTGNLPGRAWEQIRCIRLK